MPEDEDRTRTQLSNSTIHAMYNRMVQENEEAVAEQDVLTPPVIPNTASQLCKEITLLAEGD